MKLKRKYSLSSVQELKCKKSLKYLKQQIICTTSIDIINYLLSINVTRCYWRESHTAPI